MSILDRFGQKKVEKKEYIAALSLMQGIVDCALWVVGIENTVEIVDTTRQLFTGGWEEVINASDTAVSQLEEKLGKNDELQSVVFGLMPEALEADAVKEVELSNLKKLTKELALKPLGFVEIPVALSHLLGKQKGSPQTSVLVGLEQATLTTNLFKVGKDSGNTSVPRTENVAVDVENGLRYFPDTEPLPSQMFLYGKKEDSEKVKQILLQYPWQSKLNFLHFPKIEVLTKDFIARSIALAAAGDLTTKIVHEEVTVPVSTKKTLTPGTAADFGFVQGTVEHPQIQTTEQQSLPADAQQSPRDYLAKITSSISTLVNRRPSVAMLRMPTNVKSGWIAALVGVVGVATLAGYGFWNVPKASIKILVDPQQVEKEETIIIDPNMPDSNQSGKVLAGRQLTVETTGEKTIETSGKKTVGDSAKGEVTILNKTLNTKTFQDGTILIGPNDLEFTLDDKVTIASASEGIDSLSYGKETVSVTAVDIGPDGNIGAEKDFSLKGFPTSSYSARNGEPFSGGVSREISVVSRDDLEILTDELTKDLKDQALQKLQEQLDGEEALLSESLLALNTDTSFSEEAGTEVQEVKGASTISFEALSYSRQQLFALVETIVEESIPDGFEVKQGAIDSTVSSIEVRDDGLIELRAQFAIQLFPKVDQDRIGRELSGKTLKEAEEYFQGQSSVVGVEIAQTRTLPFIKKWLPRNPSQIAVETATQ